MTNILKTDAQSTAYEGIRIGNQFAAKEGYGAATTDADGVAAAAQAVGFLDTSTTGTVTLDGDAVAIALTGGQATALVQITGTFVGTLLFEGSGDGGTNWVPVIASQLGTNSIGTNTTAVGDWRANIAGLTNFRVHLHPVTSGSANIRINLSAALHNVTVNNATALGQQPMVSSAPVVLASDEIVPVQGTFKEIVGQSVTAVNQDLIPQTDVSAYKWFSIHIMGAFVGTLTYQASNDANTWTTFVLTSSAAYTGPNSATFTSSGGMFVGPVTFRYLRVRMTSFTSNTSLAAVAELYSAPPAVIPATANTPAVNVSGGSSDSHRISTADTNTVVVKGGAGQVYGYELGNNGATDAYVKLYNKASAPVIGTDVPFRTIYVPSKQRVSFHTSTGLKMATGIALAITGGAADADATAVAAAQVTVEIDYI